MPKKDFFIKYDFQENTQGDLHNHITIHIQTYINDSSLNRPKGQFSKNMLPQALCSCVPYYK